MKFINADKYKKDIEHYRNTICYRRNVTMDDCMRILDKQEDVLNGIKAEIYEEFMTIDGGVHDESAIRCMQIIDKYRAGSEDKE